MKDGSPLVIDGTVFVLTQTVTDRAASTYNNVLLVNRTITDILGTYICTVSNKVGSDSANLVVQSKWNMAFEQVHIMHGEHIHDQVTL